MSKYNIERWDLAMTGNNFIKRPIVYIKPDIDFFHFASSNNFAVMAIIEGTGLEYDNKNIPAIVKPEYSSVNINGESSNLKKNYAIILNIDSYGYPNNGKLGTISFSGLVPSSNNIVKQNRRNRNINSISNNRGDNKIQTKYNTKEFGLLIIGIILLLLFVCFVSKKICSR